MFPGRIRSGRVSLSHYGVPYRNSPEAPALYRIRAYASGSFFAKQSASNTDAGVILSAGSGADGRLSWLVSVKPNSLNWTQSSDGSGGSTDGAGFAFIGNPLVQEQYIHYAITRTAAGSMSFFANGRYLGTSQVAANFSTANPLITIGRLEYPQYNYAFKGAIGPVRVTEGVIRYENEDFIPPTEFAGVQS